MDLIIKINDEEIKDVVVNELKKCIVSVLKSEEFNDSLQFRNLLWYIRKELKDVIGQITKENRQLLQDMIIEKSVDKIVNQNKNTIIKKILEAV